MSAYVITIANQKGGAGKSTLATHLSVAFAQMGYSTMLFDTDPQGTCSHWHAQRRKDDIGLIATSGWRLTRDLAMAREANDIIVIDTPPHAEMDIKVSTRAADLVIIPVQPSPADLWAVKETFNTVAGESRNAVVVLNRVVFRANITNDIKQRLAALEVPVAETEIGSRVLFAASMETGMTVLDGFANASQAEVMGLVREIAGKIGLTLRAAPAGNVQPSQEEGDNTMAAKKAKKAAPKKKAAAKKKPAKKATKKKGRLTQAAVETMSSTDSRKQRKAA
jgi:chromosome partitioning protein